MEVLQLPVSLRSLLLSKDMGTPDQNAWRWPRALATKPEMLFSGREYGGSQPG